MTVSEYLNAVKERLVTDPWIIEFRFLRERITGSDGYLRARLVFADGSFLEFSEYVQCSPDGTIEVITYSYHWADVEGHLNRRWDNTPHFPRLAGFPHHIHIGSAGAVVPGTPVNIFEILDEIARQ